MKWESWALRLLLLAAFGYQLVTGNRAGATVAAEGLVASLVPVAIERLGHVRVPRLVEFTFVLAMALQFISESFKLFELFYYWDKLVHPTLIALSSMVATYLLLGYRERGDARLSTRLAAALGWLFGASLGAFWEFVEFTGDWFANTDLQKSNADTMTDLLANCIGALVATLLAVWIYDHWVSESDRQDMGGLAEWLTGGLGRLLAHHGRLVGAALGLVVVGLIAAGVAIDRNPPALADDLTPGASQQWQFIAGDQPAATPLLGFWTTDERGICRVNPEHPEPGSEKPGLLALAPGSVYGSDGQRFTLTATYLEQRPEVSQGSQMDAGLAFGIRGPDDFYLLEANALHDIVRLDRYVHGRRRDVREEVYRTRGNEWHTLSIDVDGGAVNASIDGKPLYAVPGLQDASGGIGVFGVTANATCFSQADVQVNPAAATALDPTVGSAG
ncbi:MAG: hypothetical protein JO023_18915 [Chloroflexi bacterium]|nr:hypothetical protein [Chloroflexota bacterium]